MSGTLDDLARALDRARAVHERWPDNEAAYVRLLEARAEYQAALAADLTTRNAALQRGLRRALTAISEKQAFIDRYGAMSGATRRVRRIAARDECTPLLALLDGAAAEGRVA